MNIRKVRLFLGAIALGFLGTASAIADDDHTPMEKEMKTVSDSLKSLRKIDKADYAAGAEAVRKAHAAILRSMAYSPSLVKEMKDGDEKTIALADSRRLMGMTYAILCEMEIAYVKKDDALIKDLTSKWKDLKKEGHKKYTDD
jgi:phosphoenolpyruvate-protein kinase (PTS system EI component)